MAAYSILDVGDTPAGYEEIRDQLWFPASTRERLDREAVELARVDIALGRVKPRDREEAIKRHLYELERREIRVQCLKIIGKGLYPRKNDPDDYY